MTTTMQSIYRSTPDLKVMSKSITTETQAVKEKKSLGKKIKEFFKKPFAKPATATELQFDQRTAVSTSQNLAQPAWNPYQQPAHGQVFIPGSIAVIRNGSETVGYVPGNIAVAVNRPGIDMNHVPMLVATNDVPVEVDQVMEETPKEQGELSPKFEVMSPKYNPADVAAQINDVMHMNEKEAEMYRDMRESRMLYASNTYVPNQVYRSQMKKSTIKFSEADRESIRGSRTFA